jgi:hypothetical protein
MKQTAGVILNRLTVLSIVLCLAIVGLWVRSYWVQDVFEHCDQGTRRHQMAMSYRGVICLIAEQDLLGMFVDFTSISGFGYHSRVAEPREVGFAWRFLGFDGWSYVWDVFPKFEYQYYVFIPDWFILAIAAILPSVRGISSLRRRRAWVPGRCRQCGYDLRATPDRCPECGIVPATIKAGTHQHSALTH